jgi:hypothetical protein
MHRGKFALLVWKVIQAIRVLNFALRRVAPVSAGQRLKALCGFLSIPRQTTRRYLQLDHESFIQNHPSLIILAFEAVSYLTASLNKTSISNKFRNIKHIEKELEGENMENNSKRSSHCILQPVTPTHKRCRVCLEIEGSPSVSGTTDVMQGTASTAD